MVSGTGILEKRETAQSPLVYQYNITVDKRLQLSFELPASITILQGGQKVKVLISLREPKQKRTLLTLHGEILEIEKEKRDTIYVVFFAGLQGRIRVKRAITGLKPRKTIFLSIIEPG